jgi:hypothetical protein
VLIISSAWGSQLVGDLYISTGAMPPSSYFLALLPGRKKTSARGVLHAHPLICFCFALLYFCLHRFIKKIQKN